MAAAVAIRDVLFRWRPEHAPCLDLPEFWIASGERVFLHGPSGSGKSTLLSLIGGVIRPERGSVSVLGTDLGRLAAAARDRFRAEHLGFVFQLFNLIPYLSALENILLPCRFAPARRATIRAANSTPAQEARRLAGHLGLDHALLARPALELSVGQQQRVAVARALIGRPRLIVADEPTSALDADRQRSFLDLLLDECATTGTAVLFVSHDERLAPRFDRVVALAALNRAGTAGTP
ncbi:MAG: ABC transporter ATP-binding protein [Candidatus Methylophosphatis roskildensis]